MSQAPESVWMMTEYTEVSTQSRIDREGFTLENQRDNDQVLMKTMLGQVSNVTGLEQLDQMGTQKMAANIYSSNQLENICLILEFRVV